MHNYHTPRPDFITSSQDVKLGEPFRPHTRAWDFLSTKECLHDVMKCLSANKHTAPEHCKCRHYLLLLLLLYIF